MASTAAHAFTFGSIPLSEPVGNPAIYTSLPTVEITTADIGDMFGWDWELTNEQAGVIDDFVLIADASFEVLAFDANHLDLEIVLVNNTAAEHQEAILSLGIGATPDANGSLLMAGSVFDTVDTGSGGNQTFPGGFKNIDVCIFAAGCSGGNVNAGLQSGGNFDTFRVRFTPVTGGTFSDGAGGAKILLAQFAIKWQGEYGSFELPATDIPQPAALALFGAGLLGFGAYARRRRAA